jgi:hypothetical protein
MLIITHHPEIEDVADTIYTIRKEYSYSIPEKNTLTPQKVDKLENSRTNIRRKNC